MVLTNHPEGEEYQSIFESATEGIFQSSIEGRFIKVNPAMACIFGYKSPADMLESISEFSNQIHVDEESRKQFIEELTKHDRVEGFEARYYRKDRSIIWTRTNARTLRDRNGDILYFEGFLTDISLHKAAETALVESNEKYRALVERLPGAVFLDTPDPSQKALYISPKIEEILGYSQEEWISKVSWSDIIHPEDRERIHEANKHSDKTGQAFHEEYRIRKKNGEYIWIREDTSLVRDEHGEPLFWQGFFLDISEQKQVENAIYQSEEQFKKVFQSIPIACMIATLEEGRLLAANDAYWRLSGYHSSEFLGRTSIELGFISPENRKQLVAKLKKERTLRNINGKIVTKNGDIRNSLEFYELIVFDEKDCILAMFYDVTDQVMAQQALQENEEKYRQLFEAESDAIFFIDNESGRILEANAAAITLYGYSKDELLQKKNSDLSAEPEVTRHVTQTSPLNKNKVVNIPLRYHRKKDGTIFPVEITGRFFVWQGRPVHIAAIRDITERRRVEDALRESDQNFRNIVEHTTNIYYSHTPDHILTFLSPQTREILGYEPEEALINWHELLTDNPVNQEGIELTQKAINTGKRQETYILELKHKDGRGIWVEVHESPILQDGQTVAIVGALTDITERKRSEDLLRRQLGELTILHNIALAASSSKSLDELIKRITDIIYDALLPANCGVELISEQEHVYYAHPSYRGIEKNEARKPVSISTGITGKVVSTGKLIRLGDVSQDPDYIEATKGVRSELCIPIKIQDRIIGAFNIESKQANAFSESDERLLNTVAGNLATAIEQLRLFETSQQRLKELTILNRVSLAGTNATDVDQLIEDITEIIGESLYPDNFGVLLLNEENAVLSPHPSYRGISFGKFPQSFSLDKGVCGQVAASGKPLRIANVRGYKNYIEVTPQVRSELCVPIAHGNRILGVINAESLRINMFTEDDEQLLVTIASTLATAIEKIRLLEAEKTRRQKAETLLEATTTLTTSLNMNTLLDTILEILSKVVPYDSASIALEQDGKLRIVAGRRFPKEYNPVGKELSVSEEWLHLSETHTPYILPDTLLDPTFEQWEGLEYIRGWMTVPLIVHGKLKGFINLDSRKPSAFTENDAILAQTFANSAAFALENARLFEVEQQSRQKAEALREATVALTASLELESLYETILDSLEKLIPFESASIEILNQGIVKVVAGKGLKDNKSCIGQQYLFNTAKWGSTNTSRAPIIISDVQKDDRFVKFEGTSYIRGWMGVPMFVQDKLVGFLNLDSTTVDFFTKDHAALAQTFGNQAAIAIENARLFQEESRRFQIIESMANIANEFATAHEIVPALDKITQRALELLHASTVAIYLLEEDNQTIKVVSAQGTYRDQLLSHTLQVGVGITGNIIKTGKPEVIDDMYNDTRRVTVPGTPQEDAQRDTIMSAPLILRGKTIGTINAWRNRSRGLFDESELNFLVAIANQTSMSIESIRLFQVTTRRAQEAHAIAEVGRDISSSLQLDIVLERIAHYAKDLLRAETSAVYLFYPEEDLLRAIAAVGKEANEIKEDPLQTGSGILGNIALQKTGEIVNNTLQDPRARAVKGTEIDPDEHLLGVPVLSKDQLTGLLAVWRTGVGEEFELHELDFLSSLAQQAAVAIENARLFEAEQKRRREAESLRQASAALTSSLELEDVLNTFLDQIGTLIRFNSAAVFLQEKDHYIVVAGKGFKHPEKVIGKRFPFDDELSRIVRESGRATLSYDIQKDPRFRSWGDSDCIHGWMCLPLKVRGLVIGHLTIDSYEIGAYNESDIELAMAFANQAATALENARLFQAEQRRHQEAETLRQAGVAISTSLDLESVLETILAVMKPVLPYDSARILLIEGDRLCLTATQGYSNSNEVLNHKFPAFDELFNLVRASGEPVIIKNVQKDRRFKAWAGPSYVRGWMGVPLRLWNEIIGYITFESHRVDAYDESFASLAQTFANQAALAIQNARQFEAEQRHFQEAETLRQAAEAITSTLDIRQVLDLILENLNRVVPFDSAGVFLNENDMVCLTAYKGLLEQSKHTGLLFSVDNALFHEILKSGQPLILDDAQADSRYEKWVVNHTRGWMGIPLISRGTVIGLITIDSLKTGAYKDHDATLAMTFAHQAAAAIENARLYERGEQQIRQLTVLRDIDSAISSSFDLRITLNLLIGYAIHELNADAAAILLYNPDLKSLYAYTSTGFANHQNNTISHIRIGEGLAGRVVLQRKLVHIANLFEATEFLPAPYIGGEQFTNYFGVPLISKGQIKGVMEIYMRKEYNPDSDWLNFLQTLAGQAAIAIDNVQLFRNLQRTNQELILAYDTTLAGWGRALELRDKETQGHTDRVVDLTLELARRMGIAGEELTHIMRGTLLHDIGKMGIPDHILHKPGPLTEEEWVIMRQHPKYAFDLMNPIPYLRQALDIPYAHHERWDGSGYPRGLKAEEIPLSARIFAVIDIWDALSNKRVYRDAWPEGKVIDYLRSTAGIELDPVIVEKFLELLEEKHNKNQAE